MEELKFMFEDAKNIPNERILKTHTPDRNKNLELYLTNSSYQHSMEIRGEVFENNRDSFPATYIKISDQEKDVGYYSLTYMNDPFEGKIGEIPGMYLIKSERDKGLSEVILRTAMLDLINYNNVSGLLLRESDDTYQEMLENYFGFSLTYIPEDDIAPYRFEKRIHESEIPTLSRMFKRRHPTLNI